MTHTYLYIKQHSVTGLKYFGKTTKDPYKYNGSGSHWLRHIKKHGKEHVKTLSVFGPYTDKEYLIKQALAMSDWLNIVESNEWANLTPENGIDGLVATDDIRQRISSAKKGSIPWNKGIKGMPGHLHTEETKAKISAAKKGIYGSNGKVGFKLAEETKIKISNSNKNLKKFECEHCKKLFIKSHLIRWHNNNCKEKK